MTTDHIEVFISYSHESSEHEARVLALTDRLRDDGIDAVIDQNVDVPPEGWQLWMEKQIDAAKFVLVVCTDTYLRRVKKEETPGRGLGVLWESTIMYSSLYEAGVVNTKFIPVAFTSEDVRFIPKPLKPTTYYDVGTDDGYETLYRRLTDQPLTPAKPIGTRRILTPRPRQAPAVKPAASAIVPNLVHPYPLQANFTGRVKEREDLTAWLADDEHPIYELIAMGGMGKSALTWYWLTRDVIPSSAADLGGVMWWSFYEGESSFAKFVDEGLKYVSGQVIDSERFPTTYDRAQELRRLLQDKRVLFVLDGFERQLRAYASLDAPYKSHEHTEPSVEARSCVDPITSRLLREIAAGTTRAKVLVTSRLTISDLEDRAGDPLAGVVEHQLKELSNDDAIAFMRAQGVKKGTNAKIANVCERYGYHPLSLRLLSGLIARDAKTPGDIAAAPRHDVYDGLIQRQHHVLAQSYDALPKRERELLSCIAAFRGSMPYDALAIFNSLNTERRFEEALEDLRVSGLLQRDTMNNRYNMHPIVRHYAYDRLTDKTSVHTRLLDYFANIPTPDTDEVQSIEDIAPVIELYHHTIRAGRHDEACDLYYDRIWKTVYYRFGSPETEIELLRGLFPDGEDRLPRLKSETDQAWTLHEMANAYSLSGQPRLAVRLFEQQNIICENQHDQRNLATGLADIAEMAQVDLGELVAAEKNLTRAIALFRDETNEFGEAAAHNGLGRLLVVRGAFVEAKSELRLAQDIFDRGGAKRTNFVSVVRAYRALCALLMGDLQNALAAAREARTLADEVAKARHPYERDFILSEWLLGAALVMEEKDLNSAFTHLTDALTRCRRINLVDHEPDILLALARWHRAKGNAQEAKAYAHEALFFADRREYRLKQAEIHNFLAVLALHAGNREEARQEAEIAKERAWCDGPPHCYKPALDEAEKMLKELGTT